ncbi:MAG: HAD family hydrolase, partial [Pseudomonadota bacterium]
RYLLCRERSATGLDKTGLIDARHFDPGLLEAMCGTVAVIEQLATCELGSVLSYDEAGAPVRKANSVKGAQSAVRDAVQAGAVRFAKAAQANPVVRVKDAYASRGWRDAAANTLMRFMFLPGPKELGVIKSFEHDVNLGSERMVALFDADDAAEQMRRRGLFYMKGSSRMFLPADLAEEDMNTRLALLAQKRFGLGLTYEDYAPRELDLPSLHLSAQEHVSAPVTARPSHDGYYVARLPLSESGHSVALQVGAVCEWVEITSISTSRVATLKGTYEDEAATPCKDVSYDAMREHAPGVFECLADTALVMVVPDPAIRDVPGAHMIEIVLRPLKRRDAAERTAALDTLGAPRTPAPSTHSNAQAAA